ncbi:carbon-nitrogen hydrolase family protein [Hydrocarboniphaga effusa]|jgi:predicted amidohydrolase|uniref:Nitrilase/cyanide hydratase and apolipoprotein n-acyltransferase n=1 Tax=Hydrocarboniphaga effusa AP103 TaxID=1172194 RepID=I7ZJW6_9GAMM|nr:carbon-nitrogen hydrolase family protein [Hydrocarboniphaga effusa]EIT72037.1 nitrilase/cyanide hydratase and apolipoprotein n-acyltransferase [Hydrocarboniphaga effusa AP103]
MSKTPFIAATAAFPVSEPRSFAEVQDTITRWVTEAAQRGARLLVFPEYASMSLAALFDERVRSDLSAQLDALQTLRDDYLALHERLAREHGVHILAGSFPWQTAPQRFHNRAWLCTPHGSDYQDKQIMTRFEREQWAISSGDAAKVFDTELGRLGVAICYDSEFPLLVRSQVEAGAQLLLVPSCTDAAAGYHRVRVAAQARALESQCYALVSPLVGEAPWSPAVDVNVGAAGVYGPPDRGFPDDGVLVVGGLNEPGWVYAAIDLEAVERVRANGQVLNHRHWGEQRGGVAGLASLLLR